MKCPCCGFQFKPLASLTPNTRRVLDFIVRYQQRTKLTPTYQEITDALGLKTKSATSRIVHDLVRRGYLAKSGTGMRILVVIVQPRKRAA